MAHTFIFGAIGPLGGGFAIWALVEIENAQHYPFSLASSVGALFLVLGIGWLIGVVPAALTGCAAWLMRGLRPFSGWMAANSVAGALICVGPPSILFLATKGTGEFDPYILIPVGAIGLAGAIGAIAPSFILRSRWMRGARQMI